MEKRVVAGLGSLPPNTSEIGLVVEIYLGELPLPITKKGIIPPNGL